MAGINAFLICFVLCVVFAVDCIGGAELEVKTVESNTSVDLKSSSLSSSSNESSIVKKPSNVNSESIVVGNENKGKDEDVGKQGKVKIDSGKNNSSKELSLEKVPEVSTDKDSLSKEVEDKKGTKEKKGSGEGSKSKKDQIPSKPLRKEIPHGDECDSSNKCTDEKNNLVACLRVPGNDSPDYSLLIQNKGTSPLSVNISAPGFVRLEKNTVQLLHKEDQKVKFSIGDGDNNTLITLSAGSGKCVLDFHDLVLHNSGKKVHNYLNSRYTDLLTQSPPIYILYGFLAAVLLLASVCACIKLRRRNPLGDEAKYQKLETELPVTTLLPVTIPLPVTTLLPVTTVTVGEDKEVSDMADGWDNSWGDSWDDEEAPKPPSLPVTPSLSSKGLASRRSSKEGWKD